MMNLDAFEARANEAAELMKNLSNPARLMILCRLGQGEQSVGELGELVGLNQSAVSQHLAKLRLAGLVSTRREGQTVHYRLASEEVTRVIDLLRELYCPPEAPGP